MALNKLKPNGVLVKTSSIDRRNLPTVVYFEDDNDVWVVTKKYLENDVNLLRATTSQDGKKLFNKISKIDAILMDIELKGSEFDGIQISEHIRSGKMTCNTDVPIIFVTAFKEKYSETDLVRSDRGDAYYTKPINYSKLRVAIASSTTKKILNKMPAAYRP